MDINRLLLRWCECHNRSAVNLITMGYFLNDFGILTAYMFVCVFVCVCVLERNNADTCPHSRVEWFLMGHCSILVMTL